MCQTPVTFYLAGSSSGPEQNGRHERMHRTLKGATTSLQTPSIRSLPLAGSLQVTSDHGPELLEAANRQTADRYRFGLFERPTVEIFEETANPEFHSYAALEQHLPTRFYFATPRHSWERGMNENANGLIRQYLPKGHSMAHLSQRNCDRLALKLNRRPRKRLGYRTPEECDER